MSKPSAVSDRFELVWELACAIASQLDLDTLLSLVVRRCRDVFDAEGTAILLLDANAGELYFPYVEGRTEDVTRRLKSLRFPAERGIAGAVLAARRTEIVENAAHDPRFYGGIDDATGQSTRTMLVAPLIAPTGPMGVVEIINRRDEAGFSEQDAKLAEALAAFIAIAVDNARMVSELRDREARLRSTVGVLRRDMARRDGFSDIVGSSKAIAEVLSLMESAASSPIAVLVEGETGTGKELVARGIHRASERADAPFVAVNCAALPADLLEAELFGHVRGAFTGAAGDRRGLFEAADHGTIFLDEIGDLPLAMQVKLLRVLQEGEITPVGSTKLKKVDVRVISATNRDLSGCVRDGSFRADLFYRISAFPIRVPALRDRSGDVPQLADRFLAAACEAHHKRIPGIDPEAFALLTACPWPGNVRQLRNEIERAVALTRDGDTVHAAVFSATLVDDSSARDRQVSGPAPEPERTAVSRVEVDAAPADAASLRDARAAFEARFIAEQLRARGGNVSRTAQALGISRVMLQKKMKDYGLR